MSCTRSSQGSRECSAKKENPKFTIVRKKGGVGRTTYSDANSEDGGEFACVSRVAVVEKNFFLDPFIVHGVEDGHADPEPYV